MINERDIIIVSNRLPFTVVLNDGAIHYEHSPGGLATGLDFLRENGAKWIGWPGIASDLLSMDQREEIIQGLNQRGCFPVFLTQKQIDYYYNGYCNKILWPLFHGMNAYEKNNEVIRKFWNTYKEVNEIFARIVKEQYHGSEYLWVHDYHLMLLPELLRRSVTMINKIGFFLHIPFPGNSSICKIQELEWLINGIGGSDLIGCHTKGYCNNLIESYRSLGIVSGVSNNTIKSHGRLTTIIDLPMGIDYKMFRKSSESSEIKKRVENLHTKYTNRKVILTVDRLDPTKAISARVKAFEKFLNENPQIKEYIIMRIVAVPSRTELPEYIKTKQDLEDSIVAVNELHGTNNWTPIEYTYGSVSFDDLVALYRFADIAFITPQVDGMNLVAKEYVACKNNRKGALVLSKTAGAAQQLVEAFMVDPSSQDELVFAIGLAINVSDEIAKKNMDCMQLCVEKNDVKWWVETFIESLDHTQ